MPEARRQSVDDQLAYLRKGAVEIIPEAEFRAKLENSAKTGKPLRVYLGVDPTAPDLHLGHTVVIRKLKHFQDLGHTAIFLIGDFSAMIGDPTGQSETRPPLSREQVDANAKTYLAQVFKILDPKKTEVRYNSKWLGKLTSYEMVKLCGKYSLARMLEREDFRSRLDKNLPISVHELLYPLLTALDAVQLQSDVELGATEQKFNLLVHRAIQREYGLPGQAVLTMPILVGLDGAKKMSKSLGNYVGITDSPRDMFEKLMSMPDELIWPYYELLTDLTAEQISEHRRRVNSGELPARDAKEGLAILIVDEFHGLGAGYSAEGTVVLPPPSPGSREAAKFRSKFRDGKFPEEAKEIRLKRVPGGLTTSFQINPNMQDVRTLGFGSQSIRAKWSVILAWLEEVPSASEAERVMKQRGFEINGQIVADPTARLDADRPAMYEVRIGKKTFLRIIVE